MTGLPVARPASSQAAAEGAALQARWVIDGVAPSEPRVTATWEARADAALGEARARLAALREAVGAVPGVPEPAGAPA
jgi:hypothetical protein